MRETVALLDILLYWAGTSKDTKITSKFMPQVHAQRRSLESVPTLPGPQYHQIGPLSTSVTLLLILPSLLS